MCQNATFYEQCPHLHIPSPKTNYFSDETNEEEERTDFGQSHFALSNVTRALRAINFEKWATDAAKECLNFCRNECASHPFHSRFPDFQK